MVENSLGRLWLEGHPIDALKSNWKYYLDEAEQTPEVQAQLEQIRVKNRVLSPEDITFIDPCMGSGHILVYAFEIFMQIYESAGYSQRDAACLILEKNIHGLEIDKRAYQLAYFALYMKGRQYNRRIFDCSSAPQIYYPAGWADGEEYGSLLKIDKPGDKPEYIQNVENWNNQDTALRVWNFKQLLAQKYDVVVTNPPYIGGKGQNTLLSEFLKNDYFDTKSDTFSAFIERCGQMCSSNGYVGMFSPYVWMFIQSYEKLRKMVYRKKDIISLIQFEYSAFEEATVPVCTFVIRNTKTAATGEYLRLVDFRGGMEVQRIKTLEAIDNPNCGYRYTASTSNFVKIPGSPVAYWVSDAILKAFENALTIDELAIARAGLSTGNNDKYMRLWFEPSILNIGFKIENNELYLSSSKKYVPCNKGGGFRRWYGNNEYVVDWSNPTSMHRPRTTYMDLYYKPAITWSVITSALLSSRYYDEGYLFDHAAASLFVNLEQNKRFVLGFLNTNIAQYLLNIINPTLNTGAEIILKLPLYDANSPVIDTLIIQNITFSRNDWDSFETSWDFRRHPLV